MIVNVVLEFVSTNADDEAFVRMMRRSLTHAALLCGNHENYVLKKC